MDLHHCELCPRRCGADRTKVPGFCGGTDAVRIARAALYFGEEPCISGSRGSGAVFFSGCSLRCAFCQNRPISRGRVGEAISEDRLSEIFLELQTQGAHNINLVTPSHYAPWVARALRNVRENLKIPVVCNCGGYESDEILEEFNGLIDVYMTDLKYFSPDLSLRYSGADDYFPVAFSALKQMYAQVGLCRFSEDGLLERGVLIRHLILPGAKNDSIALLRAVAAEFPVSDLRVSIMRQYTPNGDLNAFPELKRRVYSCEYTSVTEEACRLGFLGYTQGRSSATLEMTPDFDLTGVRKESDV